MRLGLYTALTGLVIGLGVSFAADETFKPDEEGFIRNWLVLAPVPFGADDAAGALDKQQAAEEAKLQPKEKDKTKVGDKELTWKAHKCDDFLLNINGVLGEQTEDVVAYAVTYVVTDAEIKDLKMKIGSDDQCKVYLNGKEVIKNPDARPTEKDQNTADVTLVKGLNVIVFKIVNEKVDFSGCLRFVDKDDKAVTGYKVALKP
jgi:hypothetical protein